MIRSVLFTPTTRLDRLERGLASGADLVVLDLEDGVGPGDKVAARAKVSDFATGSSGGGFGGNDGDDGGGDDDRYLRLGLRINSLSTPEGILDMAIMLSWSRWPAVLVLPKVSSQAEICQVVDLIATRPTRLLITLETARGIADAADILSVAPKSAIVGYGSADHMAETGGRMMETGLAWGRGQVVNAAAAANLPALDGVWLNYRDEAGLEREAELVQEIGFSGKIAIHPDQIETINRVFSPSEDELTMAHEMVAASEDAGGGAFSFNGKMVDAPVLARAHRLIEFNDRSTE